MLLESRAKTTRQQQRQRQRLLKTLQSQQLQRQHLRTQRKLLRKVNIQSWKLNDLKFCFSSGAAAATNQTDVSFRRKKICVIFGFCKVLIIQVGSNATDTGAAPTPAPTTTSTTTTTTTTEKPLEPCQCLGDPSLLNNTENAK